MLNVKNVSAEEPPTLLPSGTGACCSFTNEFTFGRMFILGLSKRFEIRPVLVFFGPRRRK